MSVEDTETASLGLAPTAGLLNGARKKPVPSRYTNPEASPWPSCCKCHAQLVSRVLNATELCRFPTLDGITTSAPLFAANLQSGTLSISWTTWAAANPDLRIIEIKRVFTPTAGGSPTVLDTTVPLPSKTAVTLSTSYTPVDAVTSELWLQAVDSQGRRFHTRYTGKV